MELLVFLTAEILTEYFVAEAEMWLSVERGVRGFACC